VQKGRLLIVDDEHGIRELLISEFSKLGYAVSSALNGEDAISKLQSEIIDVVITDMKMPKIDGLDLLKYVKEHSAGTEVIIITGYATVENALDAMRNGAYDFIQKPFNIDELSALVEKAMEKSELKMLLAFYESSNAVYSSLNLEELFPIMTSLIKKATSSQDTSIVLVDSINKPYIANSTYARYSPQERSVGVLASKIYDDENMKAEPLFFETSNPPVGYEGIFAQDINISSVLAYPMIFNKKVIGYLVLTKAPSMQSFVKSDLRNVSIFVVQIAQSITNTRLYEKLEVKLAELEQTSLNLSNAKNRLRDVIGMPVSKMTETAAFISEKADYIVSLKDVPPSAATTAEEMKVKVLQCLQEIQNQEQRKKDN